MKSDITYSYEPLAHVKDYDGFVSSVKGALVYYASSYLRFLEKVTKGVAYICLARHDGNIIAAMPMIEAERAQSGLIMNSLPFFGGHGSALYNREGSPEYEEQLLLPLYEKIANRAEERGALSLTIVENPFIPFPDDLSSKNELAEIDFRIGQFTPLAPHMADAEDRLMAQCHQKTRNAIRKGRTFIDKIEIQQDLSLLPWMQDVHAQSIGGMGGNVKTLDVFQILLSQFPLGDGAQFSVAYANGVPAAALLTLYFGDTVEYFTPVVEEEFKSTQILSALIFETMVAFSKDGFRQWNWGGTWQSQEGVYRFKQRFGATDYPYRYFHKSSPKIKEFALSSLMEQFPYTYLYKY